jgi:hypothetical protein
MKNSPLNAPDCLPASPVKSIAVFGELRAREERRAVGLPAKTLEGAPRPRVCDSFATMLAGGKRLSP